jgi:hypothetical protein
MLVLRPNLQKLSPEEANALADDIENARGG